MSNASAYENISERFFENAPTDLIYGLTDSRDLEEIDAEDTVARDIQNFRQRIESYVLAQIPPSSNLPEIKKLLALNEKWRNECDDIHRTMTSEDATYCIEKIDYRERSMACNLREIVRLSLSQSQIFNAAAYERRLRRRQPRKSYCYACKKNFLEDHENYCINCGGVKCNCGHCFCNWGG